MQIEPEEPLPCVFRNSRNDCLYSREFEVDRPLPAVVVLQMVVQRCSVDLAAECPVRKETK